jgi:hypothetical protein
MSDVFVAAVAAPLDSTGEWNRAWHNRPGPQVSRNVRSHRLRWLRWLRSDRPKHAAILERHRRTDRYRRAIARLIAYATAFMIHRVTSPPIVDRVRDTWAQNLPAGWLEDHGHAAA